MGRQGWINTATDLREHIVMEEGHRNEISTEISQVTGR